MAEADLAPYGHASWTQRLFEAVAVRPLWVGLGGAALLVAAYLAQEWLLGRFSELSATPVWAGAWKDFRLALVNILMLVYAPTAQQYVIRGARRALEDLRPALDMSGPELGAFARQVGIYEPWRLRIAGALGVSVALILPLFAASAELDPPYDASLWTPEVFWHRWTTPVIGWFMGRFLFAVIEESGRMAALAERLKPIDLFDLRPLAPFTAQGLRHALLITGFVAIFALFLLEWGYAAMVGSVAGSTAVFAAIGLILPVRGAHRRIRAAKRAELDACRDALRRARRESVLDDDAGLGRVADLLVYERRLEAVRVWPFDTSTLARFALYLLIPVGSWLGGALVERAIDSLLE